MAYNFANLGLGNNVGQGLAFGLYNPLASQNNSSQIAELQKQIAAMQKVQNPAQSQAMTGNFPAALGNQFNRLTMQANDALYGGILGYQPKPITSPTGNQYQPPTNQGFQFPFGLLGQGMQQGGLMMPSWRQGGM